MKSRFVFLFVLGAVFTLLFSFQPSHAAGIVYSMKLIYADDPKLGEHLDSLKALGMDIIFDESGLDVSTQVYIAFLDLANARSMKVVANLCNNAAWGSGEVFQWQQTRARDFISAIKDHPAVYGVWLVNEWGENLYNPHSAQHISADQTKLAYQDLKLWAPDLPVIITMHYWDHWDWDLDPTHPNHYFSAGQCDILCYNLYTNYSQDGSTLYFRNDMIREEGPGMLDRALQADSTLDIWLGVAAFEETPDFLKPTVGHLRRDIKSVLDLSEEYPITGISFFGWGPERWGSGWYMPKDGPDLIEVIREYANPFYTYAYLGPKNFIPGNSDPNLSVVFAGNYDRIILAFVWPDENGRLKYYENIRMDILPQLSQNGIDFAVSLGGEGTSSGFKSLADPVKLKRFVSELETFSVNHCIKKVDIDWEFPAIEDGGTLISLISELKRIFENVSLIVPYQDWTGSFPDTALRAADEIFVMVYPQAGLWNQYASHINALDGPDFSVKKSLHYWIDGRHIPPKKLLLGLSYYGFAYYGVYQLGQSLPSNPRGDFVVNFEIQRRWGHLTTQWDGQRQVPYIVAGDTLIVFDNEQSYNLKIAYAKQLGLKGVFFWQIGQEVGQFDTSVDSRDDNVLPEFTLCQNYPNPFNAGTTIKFALPKEDFVTLKIYNILGEEIATLVAEQTSAGVHRLNWDARGMASGVYLYQLNAGNFMRTKKLILVR